MRAHSAEQVPAATVASVKPTPLEAEVTPPLVPAAPAVRVPSDRPAPEAEEPASFGSPVALSARLAAPDEPTATARVSKAPDSGPQIEAREISMPRPKKGAANMITLTLLDGSKVNLPSREAAQRRTPKRRSLPPTTNAEGGELTARDLIAALRAVSHGADATEILGDNVHWEALFSALLSLLLKKHLIADWEFVEEYKKV
jgi:hypothetical protein